MQKKLIGAFGIAISLTAQAHAQTQYVAMALKFGSQFTGGCVVNALSDNGLSAGVCYESDRSVPSVWDARGNQTLLPVPSNTVFYLGVTGINSAGQVSGWFIEGGTMRRAVRWDNGQPILLAPGFESDARGINEAGDVVGTLQNSATIWKHDGSLVVLAHPESPGEYFGYSTGMAINALGAVAGWVSRGYDYVSVIWQRGNFAFPTPEFTSGYTYATALNVRGTVVGFYEERGSGIATAWKWASGQASVPLSGLPGSSYTTAYGINRSEVIVGQSCVPNAICCAVSWTNGVITRLDTVTVGLPQLGGNLTSASAINSRGWIAAQYEGTIPPYRVPVILKPVR